MCYEKFSDVNDIHITKYCYLTSIENTYDTRKNTCFFLHTSR